jgi:uncharacterized damage-inducible protein DinB
MTIEPTIERVDPPQAADEAATLLAYLDYHRDTLRLKAARLNQVQLDISLAPSTMTLGGMLKHLAFVEHWWFACVFEGREYHEPWASVDWRKDADWDWHSAAEDTAEELLALLASEIAESDRIIHTTTDCGQLSVRAGRTGSAFSLRWILCHMIEEYARHNGHADLIREWIDGEVGE